VSGPLPTAPAGERSATERPLAGLKVLDLSRLLPGPFATMMLAELGAQVDKVEDPLGGDYLRIMPPEVGGMNAVFHALNRGKRSVVLDLKKPEARAALLRLVGGYDVLVESFRPGVLERLGLGYAALREKNPRLVYCAITGYGQTGPLAHRAGHDLDYLARAGVLGLTGPEGGPPQVPGVQMADVGGGALFAVAGVLAALTARATSGEGRFVDVSMCEGALAFGLFGLMSRYGGMGTIAGADVLGGGIAPYNTYETKDGKAIALAALEPKFWMAFSKGVGMPLDLEALVPGPHQREGKRKVAELIAARTRDEWASFAEQHDCCLEPVLEPDELPRDPQHLARGVFTTAALAGGATLPIPRTPLAAPFAEIEPAPRHGQHTREVLAEAGLDADELAALGV
jgi:crotonobetainyl-CoA:carnitine CoA-transferase CaiB-like acyl-CoA transferase